MHIIEKAVGSICLEFGEGEGNRPLQVRDSLRLGDPWHRNPIRTPHRVNPARSPRVSE